MELSVRRNDLVRELHLVQGIVERKSSIPVLSNVLAEARSGELHISATDLDVSIRCGCEADVKVEGAITLAAKKLYEIARVLPDADVRIKLLADSWVAVECEQSSFKMAGLPREDFPALPDIKGKKGIELPGDVVRGLVTRTSFAITAEDARYYLAGALLLIDKDGVAMVATDGHRLAYARTRVATKGGDGTRVLVPRKAILEIGRLLEEGDTVVFQQMENYLTFGVGRRALASKMIEGQFPAFEKVVAASGDKKVSVGRDALALAVRRVSLLSSERSRAVRLALAKERLELSASSPDLGEAREAITVSYAGEPVEIGFNAQYLQDFLAAVGSDKVSVELKDAESQGIFAPEDAGDEYRYVVMPMRL